MSKYSIKDLETLSGIKAHTIRIWEQRYNLLSPERTDTNIRYYSDKDVKTILNVSLLNQNGIKISKIAQLSTEEINEEVRKITSQNQTFPEHIQSLTLCMLDMDELKFEQLMAQNIEQFGFEKTMIFVIYPLLHKVGMLWLTGAINPAHEHFISNLIRQKLISAINEIPPVVNSNSKKHILFLPENEYHELSLLFSHYVLKANHKNVLYLGANLPFEDLVEAYKIYKGEVLLCVFTSSNVIVDIESYLNKLSMQFPYSKIYVTGFQIIGMDFKYPENVEVLNKIEQVYSIL